MIKKKIIYLPSLLLFSVLVMVACNKKFLDQETVGLLTELQGRRELNATFLDKEAVYKNIIEGYQNDEELYKRQIENLKLNIEAVTPSWYDNFWTGAAVAGLIVSSIYFLTR